MWDRTLLSLVLVQVSHVSPVTTAGHKSRSRRRSVSREFYVYDACGCYTSNCEPPKPPIGPQNIRCPRKTCFLCKRGAKGAPYPPHIHPVGKDFNPCTSRVHSRYVYLRKIDDENWVEYRVDRRSFERNIRYYFRFASETYKYIVNL